MDAVAVSFLLLQKIQFLCKPSSDWGPGEIIEFTGVQEEEKDEMMSAEKMAQNQQEKEEMIKSTNCDGENEEMC